jgi:DNA polymerase-3 subunit gamma/tau
VLQLLPAAADEDDEPSLIELAQRLPPEDVQVCYQISVLGRRDLPWAPDARMGFEMTLLRMLAFRADEDSESATGTSAPATRSQPPAASATRSTVSAPSPAKNAAAPTAAASPPPPTATAPQIAEPAVAFAAASTPELPAMSGAALWDSRIQQLGLDATHNMLARSSAWVEETADGGVLLQVEHGMRGMLREDRRRAIEVALARLLGRPLTLKMELAAQGAVIDSPIQNDRLIADQRQKDAQAALDADPDVREFRRLFGAEVRPGSVQPID